jgi:hypothetical protein
MGQRLISTTRALDSYKCIAGFPKDCVVFRSKVSVTPPVAENDVDIGNWMRDVVFELHPAKLVVDPPAGVTVQNNMFPESGST